MNKPIYEELYPHLFSPYTIKKTTFKNRIFAAPQAMFPLITPDAQLTMDYVAYYGNKARGGAAVVTTNEAIIDPINGHGHNNQYSLLDENALRLMGQFTDYLKTYGAYLSPEITHCGDWSQPEYQNGADPIGPMDKIMPNGNHVRAMTEEDMDRVADCFAKAALMAKRGGCEMCMIHGGHSWLLSQFISPVENQRKDKYGGSLENRARFPIMVLDRIRQTVGDDFIIEYRMSVREMNVGGGMEPDEAVEFVKMIQDKIDIIHCSTGARRNAFSRGVMHPTRFFPAGCNVELAEAMKKGGVKIPVTAIGSINDPALAERIIAEGKADFISMARSFIADPDWAEKARAGKGDDICPCIRCLRCLDVGAGRAHTSTDVVMQDFKTSTRHLECAVNPLHGRVWALSYYPERECSKRVVVVGGGPAGMQAALTAAQHGFVTTLFEASDRLGGQLKHGDGIDFKNFLNQYRDWLVRQVTKANIDIRLNTKATREMVAKENPDVVVVAVGADPIIPDIPGVTLPHVIPATETTVRRDEIGQNVVVIGGGMVGCECALELGRAGKHVTLIQRSDLLAKDGTFTERMHTIKFMEEVANVSLNTTPVEITETEVKAIDQDGLEKSFPADTVIIAAGMKARAEERDSFWGTAFDVINVGDCKKPSTLQHATRTGFDAIFGITTRNIHIH